MGNLTFGLSPEEKKKISDQHKKLEEEARLKKEELKKGLQKPDEKNKTTN